MRYTFAPLGICLIAGLLAGCASVQPYVDRAKETGAYKSTSEFVGRYHQGTPCSGFRYNDAGCD